MPTPQEWRPSRLMRGRRWVRRHPSPQRLMPSQMMRGKMIQRSIQGQTHLPPLGLTPHLGMERFESRIQRKKEEDNPSEKETSSSANSEGGHRNVMGEDQPSGSSPNHIGDETQMEDDDIWRGWMTSRGTWGAPHLVMR